MRKSPIKMSFVILYLLASIVSQDIFARLRFADQTATIAVQPGYSRVRISNNDNIAGWVQQSIKPASEKNNAWLSDNIIIGYGAGVTQKPPTHFTYNNSNAIAKQALTVDLALNYNTPTTFSNRIRYNSNALNYYAPIIRSNSWLIPQNSNALLYGIHNDSTALVSIVQQVSVIIGQLTLDQPTYNLSHNLFVSNRGKISAIQNCVVNGNGHFILFAQNNPGCVEIATSKTLTFSNVALKDFSDDVFSLGTGASAIFGDGTTIALSLFRPLSTLSRNWVFNGRNITLYGFDKTLDMNNLSISVTGTLALQNIVLNNLRNSLLNATSSQSNIILRDTTLNLSGAYNYTTGALEIQKDVIISGTNIFSYKSNRQLVINPDSTLIIDTGAGFKYDPSSNDRDLIYMKDRTSRMFLNGCELTSSATGMRLTRGTLFIDETNDVKTPNSSTIDEGISLGNGVRAYNLNIVLFPSAVMTGPGIIILDNV